MMTQTLPFPRTGSRATASAAEGSVLALLIPIKCAGDVVYGARYARRLAEWGIRVKVNLLHVTQTIQDVPLSSARRQDPQLEAQAEAMMHEAGLYLLRSQIDFATFIFSGELVFSILDTAELLDCQEIVLPEAKSGGWPRLFSSDLARKLARASRSATVLLADPDGMSCPVQPS